jgi:hypothetical protein
MIRELTESTWSILAAHAQEERKRRGQIFHFDISFFINTICQFQRSDPFSPI